MKCVNYDGGYQCVCNDGYYKSGSVCKDINECSFDSVLSYCPTKEKPGCYNTAGSYSCHNPVVNFVSYMPLEGRNSGSPAVWNYELRKYQGFCDMGWTRNDANVWCIQLGYVRGNSYTGSRYGSVNGGNYYSMMVTCSGYEANILDCPSEPSTCTSSFSTAGVYCYTY